MSAPLAVPIQQALSLDLQNPYAGLQPFAERDRRFFFGRDNERNELARLVRREVLTVLFGRSGLGKTSLLNAGLFPLVRQEQYLPLPIRLDFSPAGGQLAAQIVVMVRQAAEAWGVEAPTQGDGEALWEYFHRAQLWDEKNRLLIPLLVFDQFEEIFTLGRGDARLQPLLAELGDLIENRIPVQVKKRLECGEDLPFSYERQSFRVIFSLREDYLPDLEDLGPLIPSLAQNRFRLKQMNGVQALAAILLPGGGLVSEEVAHQILHFLAEGKEKGKGAATPERLEDMVVEPSLLSLFCRELNDKRQARALPAFTGDLVAGEREKILYNFYEHSMAGLPQPVRSFVEDRLLTSSGFRRSEALEDALRVPGVTEAAITILVDRRLLSLEHRLGGVQIELIHDVLTHVIQESRDGRHRRENRRRMVRNMAAVAAALAILALGSLAIAIRERRLKESAQAERSRAEGLINVILFDLRDGLSEIGRLDLLGKVQKKAYVYFEGLPEEGLTDDSRRNRSVAFDNLGDVFSEQGYSQRALILHDRAFAINQDLFRKDPKNPVWQRDLEVSHNMLATKLEAIGQYSNALSHARARLAIAIDLAKEDSENILLQQDALKGESSLGRFLLRLGDAREGVDHLNKAARIARNLTERDPTDRDLQGSLTATHLLLGSAELNYFQVQKGLEHFQAAVELSSLLTKDSPSTLVFRRLLAEAHSGLGSAQSAQDKVSMALVSYEEAFQALAEAATRSDRSLSMESQRAQIYLSQATALIASGDAEMGFEKAEKARQTYDQLAKHDSENADWQDSLATSYAHAGEALLAEGQKEAALSDFEQTVRIATNLTTLHPGIRIFETDLAWSHFLVGDAREALGDTAGARKEWAWAQQLADPWVKRAGNSGVLDTYIRASIALGSLEKARPLCDKLRERGWNKRRVLDLCALLP